MLYTPSRYPIAPRLPRSREFFPVDAVILAELSNRCNSCYYLQFCLQSSRVCFEQCHHISHGLMTLFNGSIHEPSPAICPVGTGKYNPTMWLLKVWEIPRGCIGTPTCPNAFGVRVIHPIVSYIGLDMGALVDVALEPVNNVLRIPLFPSGRNCIQTRYTMSPTVRKVECHYDPKTQRRKKNQPGHWQLQTRPDPCPAV